MVLNPHELSLNIKPTYIPKTISEFLGEVSTIRNVPEKLLKLDNFIKRLEDEMRKIDAFKRELPLIAVLINDAIVALKEELNQCKKTSVEPVLEEFLPLKKSCDETEKDEIMQEKDGRDNKKNWMSSVQLWNNSDNQKSEFNHKQDPNLLAEINKKSEQETDAKTEDLYQSCTSRTEKRPFMPFNGYSHFPVAAKRKEDKKESPVADISLLTPGISRGRVELGSSVLSSKTGSCIASSSSSPVVQSNLQAGSQLSQQHSSRKQRRCWSPELHRRFVSALQQLGGSEAATPKQIRELMQVDGLTNDEVKSHLQKYRLHTRRAPGSSSDTPANQSSSLVLGGGLWKSKERYGESSKTPRSESTSPEGPLQLTETTGGTSTTFGDSMEEDEDKRSESYSWKSRIRATAEVV